MVDEQWWKQHGKAVKARLTRAEGNVKTQPQFALGEAEKVFAIMDEHGYPDWWHRVERLKTDATFQVAYDERSW